MKLKNNYYSVLRYGISKLTVATLLFGVSTTAFASLEDCYQAGEQGLYSKAVEECKPYADNDIKALGLVGSGLSAEKHSVESLPYLEKYIAYYKSHSVDDKLNLALANGIVGNIYYFGSAEPKYPKDTAKGIKYITKGAQLGSMYASNKTLPKNFSISYYWYELGKLNGGSSYSQKSPSYVHQNLASFKKQLPYCIAVGDQMVAQAYLDGFGGLAQDKSEAKKYLAEAIELYKKEDKPTADEIKYCSPPKGSDISLESAEKLYKSL